MGVCEELFNFYRFVSDTINLAQIEDSMTGSVKRHKKQITRVGEWNGMKSPKKKFKDKEKIFKKLDSGADDPAWVEEDTFVRAITKLENMMSAHPFYQMFTETPSWTWKEIQADSDESFQYFLDIPRMFELRQAPICAACEGDEWDEVSSTFKKVYSLVFFAFYGVLWDWE